MENISTMKAESFSNKIHIQNVRSKFGNDFTEYSQVTIFLDLMTFKVSYRFFKLFPAFERTIFSSVL